MKLSPRVFGLSIVAIAASLATACSDDDASSGNQFSSSDSDSKKSGVDTSDGMGGSVLAENESPGCIAADAATVFWMNQDGTVAGARTNAEPNVIRVFRSQSNPPFQSHQSGCGLIRTGAGLIATAAESNALYFISVDYEMTDGGITGSYPVIGARTMPIGSFNQPIDVVTDGTSLFVMEASGAIEQMAWPAPDADAGADAGTELVRHLGQGQAPKSRLLLSGNDLYWFDALGLETMSKTGGAITTLVPGVGRNLVVANGSLFWTTGSGDIATLPLAGGPAQVLRVTTPTEENASEKQADGDDDDDVKLPSRTSESGESDGATALATDGTQLIVARDSSIDILPLAGGEETQLYWSGVEYEEETVSLLTFDTQRTIWVTSQGTIAYRSTVE